MRVEFENDGAVRRGKVVATVVEEKDISIRTTVQVIRFVVVLRDGTFVSVPVSGCRRVRGVFRRIFGFIK